MRVSTAIVHKKRASESSALTTVSSIRSSTVAQNHSPLVILSQVATSNGTAHVDSNCVVRGGTKLPVCSSNTCCSAQEEAAFAQRHFEFPPPHPEVYASSQRESGGQLVAGGAVAVDAMSVQSSMSNLAETSSNLERDLEIIDLLERERSMDIQQGLEWEQREQCLRLDNSSSSSRRRQLPSVHGHSKRGLLATDTDQCERLLLTSE